MSGSEDISYSEISFLTFQAVVEVIIICFAGFWSAKTGLLNSSIQKNVSLLNVDLFTPCLIFSKLAPSLSFKKLIDIFVIPIFYAVSTGISYICSRFMSNFLGLNSAESDYVTAMAVFGNSNSLPVSLTLALAYTLPDLDWDDLNGEDSPDKIASRGILYLLVFQQLGQVLRWSWGYNTLLRKRDPIELRAYGDDPVVGSLTQNQTQNRGDIIDEAGIHGAGIHGAGIHGTGIRGTRDLDHDIGHNGSPFDEEASSLLDARSLRNNGVNIVPYENTSVNTNTNSDSNLNLNKMNDRTTSEMINDGFNGNDISSIDMQSREHKNYSTIEIFSTIIFKFKNAMNPPLYAMLFSVIVASITPLQKAFFEDNGFIQNTLSLAIQQLGSVSIPLILIVLGSNLAPATDIPPSSPRYKSIVFGSLVSRMILPSLFLLPLIALCVKYLPISVLDDPIFLIVAFILTISPPAIQLSQICQLNEIYQMEMAGVLFWGYVILTLPTTIIIVVASLEVLKYV
ncbi:hypothetical protein PACTADRAFT_50495 [Pachysolen tannophilus NRRL Y-2460]|uniref:Transporter n=1 Tax=Pachysolen tannophilus NRRL Y-2460 TaxID=669874 RepID=A0A1E4TSA2_PACTA|nr:hypothetical protein PACTADRAFT_50495 [Pachysolen tannophilus NRRL Y-2460]